MIFNWTVLLTVPLLSVKVWIANSPECIRITVLNDLSSLTHLILIRCFSATPMVCKSVSWSTLTLTTETHPLYRLPQKLHSSKETFKPSFLHAQLLVLYQRFSKIYFSQTNWAMQCNTLLLVLEQGSLFLAKQAAVVFCELSAPLLVTRPRKLSTTTQWLNACVCARKYVLVYPEQRISQRK